MISEFIMFDSDSDSELEQVSSLTRQVLLKALIWFPRTLTIKSNYLVLNVRKKVSHFFGTCCKQWASNSFNHGQNYVVGNLNVDPPNSRNMFHHVRAKKGAYGLIYGKCSRH